LKTPEKVVRVFVCGPWWGWGGRMDPDRLVEALTEDRAGLYEDLLFTHAA
jgi:hypothetical protein